MRIEFTIDELVLIGFDARDRQRAADTIERDLYTALTPAAVRRLRGATAATPVPSTAGEGTAIGRIDGWIGLGGVAASIVSAAGETKAGRVGP